MVNARESEQNKVAPGLMLGDPSQPENSSGTTKENHPIPTRRSLFEGLSSIIHWIFTDPESYADDSDKSLKFNYQAFKNSRYYYLFGGRLRILKVNPRSKFKVPVFIFSLSAQIIPFVIYLIFSASWCWHNISPAIVIVFVYCWLQEMHNFLMATMLDPGVLPRNIHLVDNIETDGLPEEYYTQIRLPGPYDPANNPVYLKYCTSCFIWRPIRSSHCSRCNACIYNLDHHCKWISNCVGQRTYWNFIAFLIFCNATCLMLIGMSFYRISLNNASDTPLSLFLGIYASIGILYPLLILVYHICLGFTGITTREYLNANRNEGNNILQDVCLDPFNSGKWGSNIKRQWFRPRGLSALPVLARYRNGDKRFQTIQIGGI